MFRTIFALAAVLALSAASSRELCQRGGVCGHTCTGEHKHLQGSPVPCCFHTFDVEVIAGNRKIDCRFRGGMLDLPGKYSEYCCARFVHSHLIAAPLEPASSGGASSGMPVAVPRVSLPGVYLQNRFLGSDQVTHNTNPLSHTFVFTIREDGKLSTTYSWGNASNLRGWHKDAREDICAASEAIAGGSALDFVGEPGLLPFIEGAFQMLSKPEFDHLNQVVDANCKTEALNLIKLARELQSKKR